MRWWRWLQRYQAHADPQVATGNFIAVMVGTNQPFYPIYAYAMVGWDAWPAFAGVLSMPFFLAVPWLARRRPVAGRSLLLLAGSANVLLMTWAMGEASALELFFVPCATIAALLFRRSERPVMLALVGLPLLAYFLTRGRYPAAWVGYSDAQFAALRTLNESSVAGFIGFIGVLFGNLLAQRRQDGQS
jgi:hypothetical protein